MVGYMTLIILYIFAYKRLNFTMGSIFYHQFSEILELLVLRNRKLFEMVNDRLAVRVG